MSLFSKGRRKTNYAIAGCKFFRGKFLETKTKKGQTNPKIHFTSTIGFSFKMSLSHRFWRIRATHHTL